MASKLSMMIVDDRPENLISLKQLLAQDDLEIITAESGNEALEKMLGLDLALVLLDVQMPGMDGFEVAELMRRNEKTRRIPVIFVTAINKERRHIFSGYQAGAVDYIFKPVDPFIIRSKVKVFLEIKRNEQVREALVQELDGANRRLQEISERKSEYLAAASHELRTPLTVIKEYCSLVHDGVVGPTNEEQKKCLSSALRNCNRLATLVDDLLDLDGIESGHLAIRRRPLDMARLLGEIVADFRPRCETLGQLLDIELEEDLPQALGDPGLITQVMVNLLGNANKFTPGGGKISVIAKKDVAGLVLSVKDNGPGIPVQDQQKVFQKFTQLNRTDGPGPQGTGLGLAISQKLVTLLGGKLSLSSRQGHGATFSFTLPTYTAAGHLSAFVKDGTCRGLAAHRDWTLLLFRPKSGSGQLPEWLAPAIESVIRHTDEFMNFTDENGLQGAAVLLPASPEGANVLLARLGESLIQADQPVDQLSFARVFCGPDFCSDYSWEKESPDFQGFAEFLSSKGMSYV